LELKLANKSFFALQFWPCNRFIVFVKHQPLSI
jgi:hypothetical protein